MSEQNRTAPRWEDAREHTLKLLREERDSIAAELPMVENVDERELFDAWLARVDLALTTIGAIDDAALARLAEPERSAEPVREVAASEHPCARRCWRIGAPAEIVDGVCAECSSPGRKREPTAAERWRAVPREDRRRTLRHLAEERARLVRWIKMNRSHQSGVSLNREEIASIDALLALAREAEGGGV